MYKSNVLNQYMNICRDSINNITTKLNKSFETFLMETFILYMVIPRKINFLQLGRYGKSSEQRFRQNFSKKFDWFSFNLSLSSNVLTGKRKAIAIDPSYITKSGKSTPWVGYFWSGCAGMAKRGLEILGISLIDVDNKDCFALEAVQTPDTKTLKTATSTLVDWYLYVLDKMKDKLLAVSKYIVADAYFSKKTFADSLIEKGFHLISRFRDDVTLKYLTLNKPTGKRGRPRLYDGKVNLDSLNMQHFKKIKCETDNGELYTSVVYACALKRKVRVTVWYSSDKKTRKIYFSTDTDMSGLDVIEYYRTRFQIEFVFRDAKQFTGLNHCQARSIDKLHFAFNASLACVNVSKVLAKKRGMKYSMTSLKTLMYNTFLLNRFIHVSGLNPNKRLNNKLFKELACFAVLAA